MCAFIHVLVTEWYTYTQSYESTNTNSDVWFAGKSFFYRLFENIFGVGEYLVRLTMFWNTFCES